MASIIDMRLRIDEGTETPAIRTSQSMAEKLKAQAVETVTPAKPAIPTVVDFSQLQARFG